MLSILCYSRCPLQNNLLKYHIIYVLFQNKDIQLQNEQFESVSLVSDQFLFSMQNCCRCDKKKLTLLRLYELDARTVTYFIETDRHRKILTNNVYNCWSNKFVYFREGRKLYFSLLLNLQRIFIHKLKFAVNTNGWKVCLMGLVIPFRNIFFLNVLRQTL